MADDQENRDAQASGLPLVNPDAPLSRRELRERERLQAQGAVAATPATVTETPASAPTVSAEDALAIEMERQVARFRSASLASEPALPTSAKPEVVQPEIAQEPIAPLAAEPAIVPPEVPAPGFSFEDLLNDATADLEPLVETRKDKKNKKSKKPTTEKPAKLTKAEKKAAAAEVAAAELAAARQAEAEKREERDAKRGKPQTAVHVPALAKPAKPSYKKNSKRSGSGVTPIKTAAPVRKRRGAKIFTFVAMFFIAGMALATSIPAAALLTPEQVAMQNEQARMRFAGQVGDGGQALYANGGAEVAALRDGVAVGGATARPLIGAYSDKRLKVTVPVSNNPIKWPFPSGTKITDQFGYRFLFGYSNFHTGLDFDLAYGTDIRALADGIVTLVEDPGYMCGASVTIEHNVSGNKFTSVYCHMITNSTSLKAGDTVSVGAVVGKIGNTGVTTGPHLHLEVRINELPVDPYAFLKQAAGNPPN